MKKILIGIICFLTSIIAVNATSIDTIDMDIIIDEKGNATVTETWVANVTNGTEGWHPYYNLADSKLKVISATMDEKKYEIENTWNENASMSQKAYKAGVYTASSKEKDIVFGVSSYGSHTYQIVYEITNFVKKATDADIIYWQLFPYDFSSSPKNVTIKISGPYEYPDTLDVWGYGMYGAPCYVKDGSIYMTSDGRISKNEYLTLLAKFPANTFETESILERDFNYYYNKAKEGSKTYKSQNGKNTYAFVFIITFAISFFWPIFIIILVLSSIKKKSDSYDYGVEGKSLGKVNNFRDIPCNKNVFRAFFIANIYGLNKKENDFMGVLLLKWIKDGNVIVETIEKKGLFKAKEADVITFINEPQTDNEYEKKLYKYMCEASGDNRLEQDEFKKWCRNHYSKILNWSKDVLNHERNLLINQGFIIDNQIKKGHLFTYTTHTYVIEEALKKEAKELKGLKQFLIEFSEIDKKEPIEVKLWNEYLMYAQIFGIADRVMKKFKKLYPEVIENMQQNNFNYTTFVFINSVSSSGINAASAARSAAQSYSSGGGGFSSGGGGGGSFGGGGGGGGFR